MKIYVVGIGPGSVKNMTQGAIEAIKKSDVVVGYSRYMELIKEQTFGKTVYVSNMRQEKERCKKAIEYALEGKITAVISSGDAGIYGMAGLIFEMSEKYPQLEIEVVPGITAAVSAAAALGAPLMNDFVVISLSDLLTPWEKIEKRLKAVASADFVICLYNPGSRTRREHLKRACECMLEYKDRETKCGWVRNIDREGLKMGICTLEELSNLSADMLMTIVVGSESTEFINGKLVTPRGYDIK